MKTFGLVSATAILGGFDRALAMNTGKDIWFMPDEGASRIIEHGWLLAQAKKSGGASSYLKYNAIWQTLL